MKKRSLKWKKALGIAVAAAILGQSSTAIYANETVIHTEAGSEEATVAAESEAAAKAVAESEAAAKEAAESEAAAKEAAAKAAAESEAAAKAAAESEAEAKAAAESEAEAKAAAESEAAAKATETAAVESEAAAESEAANAAAESEAASNAAAESEAASKAAESETAETAAEESEAAETAAAESEAFEEESTFDFQQVTLEAGVETWIMGCDGTEHYWQLLNEDVISIMEQDGPLVKVRANAPGEMFLIHGYTAGDARMMATFHVIVTENSGAQETEAATAPDTETEFETEMESETETETETEVYENEFLYENDEVSVSAKASDEAKLPEGTEMKVVKLAEGSPEYEAAKQAAQETIGETENAVYTFYDVTFISEGEEIEPPQNTVSVQMQFKKAQSAAEAASQSVLYIEDTDSGKVAQDVTAAVGEGENISSVDFVF